MNLEYLRIFTRKCLRVSQLLLGNEEVNNTNHITIMNLKLNMQIKPISKNGFTPLHAKFYKQNTLLKLETSSHHTYRKWTTAKNSRFIVFIHKAMITWCFEHKVSNHKSQIFNIWILELSCAKSSKSKNMHISSQLTIFNTICY